MTIIQKIKNFFKGHSKNQDQERKKADKMLNEQLTDEQNRRRAFDEKQYKELQSQNWDDERISAEQRLNEYLIAEQQRKKKLDEKLFEESQERKRQEGQSAAHRKNAKKEINKAIRRGQSIAREPELKDVKAQEQIEITEISEISFCTCDTTPNSEKIKCGFCMKSMCHYCWSKHQFSHGRTDPVSINYHSNGKTSGKP